MRVVEIIFNGNSEGIMEIVKGATRFEQGIATELQWENFCRNNPSFMALAFIGRSNVGKSSLINGLFGRNMAKTSKTPGKTREINLFRFSISPSPKELLPLYLFDLPGHGFARVKHSMRRKWDSLMKLFFSSMPSPLLLVHLQDARHPNTRVDRECQDFLSLFPYPSFLVLNKMDKLKTQAERAKLAKKKIELARSGAKQVHFVSAVTKSNLAQLEQALVTYFLEQHL